MKGVRAAAIAALASTVAADVPSIVIKGSKFFYSNNGTQFYMRGVAYQQDYSGNGTVSDDESYTDPLSSDGNCMRDIPYLQQLQTNTIRVYAIDPNKDHKECMDALSDAGIYVVADLSAPVTDGSINRDDPSWNDGLYARYTSVVDEMAKYNNTLGFFAGNEVANMPNNTAASAFVKAAVRDMKSYIKKQNYRTIGVGYATSDDQYIRENVGTYFNCGDESVSIDFLGYNIYSWCGDSTYETSGYEARTKEFASYSVPVFFAEYGCNTQGARTFSEVGTLYGDQMTEVWSGGIVYMYFQEENEYGLATVDGDNVDTNEDFDNLSSQIAKISPSMTEMDSYNPTNSAAACPTVDGNWTAKATPLPPTPNKELCTCMMNSLGCVVSADASTDDYEDLFDYVCSHGGDSNCDGIAHNATTGTYGAYGMCNATEQLAFALNNYYAGQKSLASACDFSGSATLQSAAKATGQCSSLMKEAGTAGTNTVTTAPSGTGGAGSGSDSGDSSSSSSGAANSVHAFSPHVNVGMMPVVVMGAIGLLSGMGMILL